MPTVRRTRRFARSADDVWAVIGNVGILHTWWPGILSTELSTDDEGRTVRTVTLASGLATPETILELDPLQRRLAYTVGLPLLTHHHTTVDVIELGPDDTLVVYATDCTPKPMALILGGASGAALDELARQFAEGFGPALEAAGLATTDDATDETTTDDIATDDAGAEASANA